MLFILCKEGTARCLPVYCNSYFENMFRDRNTRLAKRRTLLYEAGVCPVTQEIHSCFGNQIFLIAFNIIYLLCSILHTYVLIYHQLLHFICTTSNMVWLSYVPTTSELIIVDNKQLCSKSQNGNYTYAAVYILCYVYRFKIIEQYVNTIFRDKIYKNIK
jgi:hypothetical protein